MKKTAILFPGQGSQYTGMGASLLEHDSRAAELMDLAEDISGFPLRRLCLEGPMEELTRVVHLQPALTVINLICWQELVRLLPDLRPVFVAGHSLGEYSALHAAGVLSSADTLTLVTRRGELMEREGNRHPGGMLAVLGLTVAEVDALVEAYNGPGVAVVANHNTELQVVLAGDRDGLDGLAAVCRDRGGRVIPLKVSVANHSPLVAGAVDDFSRYLDAITFHHPRLPILFNVTATPEQDPDRIREIMATQIASRVRWFELVSRIIESEVEVIVELGPKKVLTGMLKKILPAGSPVQCLQADTVDDLVRVAGIIGR